LRAALPLQTVETVNESAQERQRSFFFANEQSPEADHPSPCRVEGAGTEQADERPIATLAEGDIMVDLGLNKKPFIRAPATAAAGRARC